MTLKQYLDMHGIEKGDTSPLVVIHGNTELQTSRRYLESEPMKHYLDMEIVDYDYPFAKPGEEPVIKFWVREQN